MPRKGEDSTPLTSQALTIDALLISSEAIQAAIPDPEMVLAIKNYGDGKGG